MKMFITLNKTQTQVNWFDMTGLQFKVANLSIRVLKIDKTLVPTLSFEFYMIMFLLNDFYNHRAFKTSLQSSLMAPRH